MKALFLWLGALLLGAVVALAQADRSKARNGADSRFDYAELSKAPEKARIRQNPLAADETAVAGGRNLFERHCAECHGESGEGGKKGPSLAVPEVQEASPGTVFWVLTNGVVRRGMPVWSKLPEAQRWQLVSYLRTLKKDMPPAAATAAK
jgi:mono/diheme cytochrome c family protein